MKDFNLSPTGVLSPAAKPARARKFSHKNAYFVFVRGGGPLVAGRISKDGAVSRTHHDQSLVYYVARDAKDAALLDRGVIPEGYHGASASPLHSYTGGAYGAKSNPVGFKHAKPYGGSVGREQWHVHFEDAKGVIYYYAGNTDKGVKLSRRFDEAMKFNPSRAAQLAKRLNALYKGVRHDGGHFWAETAEDVKVNPRDPGELRLQRAADGVDYEDALKMGSRSRGAVEHDPAGSGGMDTATARSFTITWSDGSREVATVRTAMTAGAARHHFAQNKSRGRARIVSVKPVVKANPGFSYGVKHSRDYYGDLSESALRDLLRQADPNGYATLDDDGPATRETIIEALRYIGRLNSDGFNDDVKPNGPRQPVIRTVKEGRAWAWSFTVKGEKFGGYGRTKADALNDARLTLASKMRA